MCLHIKRPPQNARVEISMRLSSFTNYVRNRNSHRHDGFLSAWLRALAHGAQPSHMMMRRNPHDDGVRAAMAGVEANVGGVETNSGGVETHMYGVETNFGGVETSFDRVQAF